MPAKTIAEIMIAILLSNSLWDNYNVDSLGILNILNRCSEWKETPKSLEYNPFIHFGLYRIVARCALCRREIIDPTECIVYEKLLFDRSDCLNIYRKLRFIYENAILDIIQTW